MHLFFLVGCFVLESLIIIFTDLHSGVEHLPAQRVHQLRGGVERQDLGHEQLLAPLHL